MFSKIRKSVNKHENFTSITLVRDEGQKYPYFEKLCLKQPDILNFLNDKNN